MLLFVSESPGKVWFRSNGRQPGLVQLAEAGHLSNVAGNPRESELFKESGHLYHSLSAQPQPARVEAVAQRSRVKMLAEEEERKEGKAAAEMSVSQKRDLGTEKEEEEEKETCESVTRVSRPERNEIRF